MSGLLDRIGEVLGLKKKPGTAAAAEPTDPKTTAQVPSGTGPGDENPDARPTNVEDAEADIEADDPRKDTTKG